MSQIGVVLADSQPLYLQGMVRDLGLEIDIDVAGTAINTNEVVELVQSCQPDVIVVTQDPPDLDALFIIQHVEGTSTLVLIAEGERQAIFHAVMLGARGCLYRRYSKIRLADAIRDIVDGDLVIGPQSLKVFVEATRDHMTSRAPLGPLSVRESQVILLLAAGHNQLSIATLLKLTPTTIRSHCRNIRNKLGVKSQAAAVAEAITRGLIDPRHPEPQT